MSLSRGFLGLAAAVELLTGATWLLSPPLAARGLLAADLPEAGVVMGRVAGAALLSLGIACFPPSAPALPRAPVLGLLTYNLLVAVYLIYLGATWPAGGVLLWPAVALHAALGAGLGAMYWRVTAA